MPREPERFVKKEKVTITLDVGVLNSAKRRAELKGFKSLSHYIETLLKIWG